MTNMFIVTFWCQIKIIYLSISRSLLRNKHIVNQNYDFHLQNPEITNFSPKKGPQSGGTRLTISGSHMNAGTTISATVVGLPCIVVK